MQKYKSIYINLVLMTFLLSFMTVTLSAQDKYGTVKGIVTDSESGLPLPGASVIVKGTSIGDFSDVNGEYRIFKVPIGKQIIQIKYIGYKEFEKSIEIKDGKTSELNISLMPGSVKGEEVLIIGEALKGQAKALNTQRNKINVTNIVSADQVGRFPDANIGDALKRIPGITIQNDQGEARFGLVRGTAARLNSVTVNGDRIPSAEAETRVVQLDLIPADMISQVEVNKVLTPDMDADAIGGSINLVTRPPSEGRVSITAASLYNFLSEKPSFNGTLIAGDRYMDGKLGVVASATVYDHILGSDNIEAEWALDDNDNAYTAEMDQRTYLVQRTRRSASLGFDYEFDNTNQIYINAIYNWRDDWENRYRLRFTDVEPTDNGFEGVIERQTKGGLGSGRTDFARLEDQRTFNLGFGGEHQLTDLILMTWKGNYAQASEERPNERYITYLAGDDSPVSLNVDNSDTEKPIITSVNDFNASNYILDELTEENQFTKDTDFNGRVDFEIPFFEGDNSADFKFGGRFRSKEKVRDNDFFEYSPTNAMLETMSNVQFSSQTDPGFLAGNYEAGNFVTKEFLGDLNLNNSDLFEREAALDEFVGDNFDATEVIVGGYLMWTQNLGEKLTILGGVRLENTILEYNANKFDEDTGEFEAVNEEDSYLNILPNIQVKYLFNEKFLGRVAYTQTLARPNYFDLAPYQIIVPEDNEIAVGNPELNATISNNFDMMFEYYFENVGILSGGVFYKDITDFIFNERRNEYEFQGNVWDEFSQPQNGGSASLYGFEFAIQRQLDFLPSFLSNLGIYLNYTFTSSSADGIQGREGEDLPLPGTAENMFNASLSYEDDLISIRIAANYASDYIDELGDDSFEDRYYDEQFFLDANASVNIIEDLRLFIEANNLTNQPLRYYQGIQSRMMQLEYYNSRVNVGFKYNL